MSSTLNSPDTLKRMQIILIGVLVFGAVGYLGAGAFHYGFESDEGRELFNDLKLIVVAGVIAAFALLGLGRRASADK